MISSFLRYAMIFSIGLMACTQARADEALSDGEDVAIAFFKTGNTNPDFDLWARKSDGYKTAAPAFSGEYLREEKQRLMRRWQAYSAEDDLIELKTSVAVYLKAKITDKSEEYWMNIGLPNVEALYFPYKFQDYQFAIMPQNFEPLLFQVLRKEQYEMMVEDFRGKASGYANLYLQLSPVKSYMAAPERIDGTDQWVMVANVASMELKSARSDAHLWSYTAPWYLSPVKEKLDGLYRENPNP